MEQLVVVRAEAPGRYTAQALGLPEVRGEGKTEAEAIQQVRESLATWLGSGKLVCVQVPANGTGNPWLDYAGRSANDPQFEAYLEEMRRAREAEDAP